jgi:hypothetical protein
MCACGDVFGAAMLIPLMLQGMMKHPAKRFRRISPIETGNPR